jgi:hypothetical protein
MTDMIAALQQAASLAAMRTTAFGTSRRDKVASQEVTDDAGAVKGAARVNVNILAGADELHQAIMEQMRSARAAFMSRTSTWDADAWRLLPNALFMELAGEIKTAQDNITALCAQLRVDAPIIIDRATQNLGTLAGRVKMPTPDELAGAYTLNIEYVPIPDGSKFSGMSPKVVAWLQKRLERQVMEKAAAAMREPMHRLADQLLALAERMDKVNAEDGTARPEGKRAPFFKDTIVTNLEATQALLGHFNLTDDPVFGAIVGKIGDLLQGVTPDGLRKDRDLRSEASRRARDILGMVNTYNGATP